MGIPPSIVSISSSYYSKSYIFRQRYCKAYRQILSRYPLYPTLYPMDNRRISGKKIIREIALLPTHLYRLIISPWLPPSCIYTPTCSSYMVESVRRHGIFKGTALGFARIARCHHTFFYGGPDPVPEEFSCESIKTPYRIFRRRKHKHTHKED